MGRRQARVQHWNAYIVSYLRLLPEIKWFVTCYLLISELLPTYWTQEIITSTTSLQNQIDFIAEDIFNCCFRKDTGRVHILDHSIPNFNTRCGELNGYDRRSRKLFVNLDISGSPLKERVQVYPDFVECVASKTTELPAIKVASIQVDDSDKVLTIPIVFDMGIFTTVTNVHPCPQECHPISFPLFCMMLSSKQQYEKKQEDARKEQKIEFSNRIQKLRIRHIDALERHKLQIWRPSRRHLQNEQDSHPVRTTENPLPSTLLDDIMGLEHLFTLPFTTKDDSLADCSDNLSEFGDMNSTIPTSKRKECDIIREMENEVLVINQASAVNIYKCCTDDVVIDMCMKW